MYENDDEQLIMLSLVYYYLLNVTGYMYNFLLQVAHVEL